MRTTVTIDPDVQILLKKAMRERDVPFKQALNDAVRHGLLQVPSRPRPRYEALCFDLGRPLVDLSKANALADELEDLALAQKLRAGL